MAVKTIDLVINTSRGEKNIKQALALAKRFEQALGNISKLKFNIKTDPAQKAIEKLNAQIERGRELTQKTFSAGAVRAFGNSIADVRDEVSAVSKAFEATSDATERMNMASALIAGNFKQIRMETVATAKATGQSGTMQATVGSVQGRLKEIREFPKTILAGKKAMGLLNKMLELAEVNSKDFLDISKAIGQQLKINAEMQKALDTASGRIKPKSQSETEKKVEKQITEEKKKQKQLEMDLWRVRQKRRKDQKKEAADHKKEVRRRVKNIGNIRRQRMQEKMLGAGFPMLFGGGAGAVAGSVAGSMLAPAGMGFGAQILGSALGTMLEQNLQKVHAIGDATRNINLDKLEESGIRVNSELENAVENLRMMNKESEAQALIAKEVANQTGTIQGTNEDISLLISSLGREWSSFTSIISSTLGILAVPFIAALTGILFIVNQIFKVVNFIFSAIGKGIKELTRLILGNVIFDMLVKYFENLAKSTQDLTKGVDDYIRGIEKEKLAIERRIELGEKEAAIQQKIAEAAAEFRIDKDKDKAEYARLENAVRSLALLKQEEEAVKRLRDLYKSLGQTIEDGLVNAIEAAINGTKTLGEVARSVFRELQRSLIRYSVNSLMRGLFSFNPIKNAVQAPVAESVVGTGVSAGISAGPKTMKELVNSVPVLPNLKANGGSVKGGNDYIVGERGPELFSPGVSGMITPNHMLGGTTNVVVNVDASGSSVEGDEQSGRELGRMISVAIQSELIKQKRPGGMLA